MCTAGASIQNTVCSVQCTGAVCSVQEWSVKMLSVKNAVCSIDVPGPGGLMREPGGANN